MHRAALMFQHLRLLQLFQERPVSGTAVVNRHLVCKSVWICFLVRFRGVASQGTVYRLNAGPTVPVVPAWKNFGFACGCGLCKLAREKK